MKFCIYPFSKKSDIGITKNYGDITFTAIIAKVNNTLFINRIGPEIEKVLSKNQKGFQRNRSTTLQRLTIFQIIEGVRVKNLEATLLFVNFSKIFDSILRRKMRQILHAFSLPQKTAIAIIVPYKNTEAIDQHFSFLSRGIILWIELPWPEDPATTYARHAETLDSYFDLIRSHQQCIPWSPPLEIEPATTDCRAETLQPSHSPYLKRLSPN